MKVEKDGKAYTAYLLNRHLSIQISIYSSLYLPKAVLMASTLTKVRQNVIYKYIYISIHNVQIYGVYVLRLNISIYESGY